MSWYLMPFVSVIVPVFRTATQLSRCLKSILTDRDKFRMEVIVVDDCSDDGSWDMLQEYGNKYPEIRLTRHAKNRGLPYARQTGVDLAIGNYLLHIDSDDALAPGALVDMVIKAKQTDADIIQTPLQYATEHTAGEPLTQIRLDRVVQVLEGELFGDEVAKSLGHYWSRKFLQYTVTGKLYRRTLWKTVAPLVSDHPSLGEDVIFNVQLAVAARSAALLARPGVIYIRRKGSYMEERWGARQFASLFENGAWIEKYLKQIGRQQLMVMKSTYVRDIVVDLGTRRAKESSDEGLIAYLQLMVRYSNLLSDGEDRRAFSLLRGELRKRHLLDFVKALSWLIHRSYSETYSKTIIT